MIHKDNSETKQTAKRIPTVEKEKEKRKIKNVNKECINVEERESH